jgi:hypothetical protein
MGNRAQMGDAFRKGMPPCRGRCCPGFCPVSLEQQVHRGRFGFLRSIETRAEISLGRFPEIAFNRRVRSLLASDAMIRGHVAFRDRRSDPYPCRDGSDSLSGSFACRRRQKAKFLPRLPIAKHRGLFRY